MHSRFYRQLGRSVALAACTVALAGCVQATRHSNTMVFGTNTTVGFKVGQNVNQVPEIMLAYDRQEAVIMPLLANVEGEGESNLLNPCDPTEAPAAAISVSGGGSGGNTSSYAVHPCSFVGYRNGALDSYSVLASFGANFQGGSQVNGSNNNVEARAGLAQYFATGMAAQMLALTGGAAVVSTTGETPDASQSGAASSVFATAEQGQQAQLLVSNYSSFADTFTDYLEGKSDSDVQAFIAEFEQQAGFTVLSGATPLCGTASACSTMIDGQLYLPRYQVQDPSDRLNTILAGLIASKS